MLPPQIIFGYHGCDETIAKMILEGGHMKASTNPWDWLGHGIYFWERSVVRALRWAREMTQLPGSLVRTPAVVGAIINLGTCLDLADPESADFVTEAYADYIERCRSTGVEPARNKGPESKARFLDCSVINFTSLKNSCVPTPFVAHCLPQSFTASSRLALSGTNETPKT